ncbi:MAG: hypothetical protein GY765_21295, partial [bacterium]|nr:hypothetical protein [bacterium]
GYKSKSPGRIVGTTEILRITDNRGTFLFQAPGARVLQTNLKPRPEYADFALSRQRLEERVSCALRRGSSELLHLQSGTYKKNSDITVYHDEILFFHTPVSTCSLQKIIAGLAGNSTGNESGRALVFSCIADSDSLRNSIAGIHSDVYIDYRDTFDLMAKITEESIKPITIETRDFLSEE